MSSYDRIDGETPKAYHAFTLYRGMGANRSLDRVAVEFYTVDLPQKCRRNIRQIETWSSHWGWVDRCKDFDRDEELIRREQQRQRDVEEYDSKLELFRQQNESVGMGLLDLAAQLLDAMTDYTAPVRSKLRAIKDAKLQGEPIDPSLELNKSDHDVMQNIPNSIRGIAAFASIGGDLAADGLLVRQLLAQLQGNQSQSSSSL